jgi:hypothetical protein
MARTYVPVLLALSALAIPSSSLLAQSTTPGNVLGEGGVETCRARAGGSRMRSNNCEDEEAPKTVRTEHELTVKLELPGASAPQCEASALTEYSQRSSTAQVMGTVSISNCPAGTTGSFTLVARVRDTSGEIKTLEFKETWQRDDAQDHAFKTLYPIGDDVELVSMRVRSLLCTCASAPAAEAAILETTPQPAESPVEEL